MENRVNTLNNRHTTFIMRKSLKKKDFSSSNKVAMLAFLGILSMFVTYTPCRRCRRVCAWWQVRVWPSSTSTQPNRASTSARQSMRMGESPRPPASSFRKPYQHSQYRYLLSLQKWTKYNICRGEKMYILSLIEFINKRSFSYLEWIFFQVRFLYVSMQIFLLTSKKCWIKFSTTHCTPIYF